MNIAKFLRSPLIPDLGICFEAELLGCKYLLNRITINSNQKLTFMGCLLKWVYLFHLYRSSHRRCSVKRDVLKNFTKFTGIHLCQSLFFNKVTGGAGNFIKKLTLAQVFFCEFCEIFKNTFFTEHLWTTASVSI